MRITRIKRAVTNVTKAEVQHNNTFQTNTKTTVRPSAKSERVNIILQLDQVDAESSSALLEELGDVHTLSTRGDFLTSHEDIVRVGEADVVGTGHSVEGAEAEREAVDDVEIDAVTFLDDTTEELLVFRVDVVSLSELVAFDLGVEDGNGPVKVEAEHLLVAVANITAVDVLGGDLFFDRADTEFSELVIGDLPNEGREGILVVDSGEFLGERGEVGEHVVEQVLSHVQDFVVVLVDTHFQIQADEFGQVAVSVGVLSAEDGSDFEDTLQVTHQGHFLVELGTLSEVARATHVVQLEDRGTTFRSSTDHLGAVDFSEVVV